MNDFGRLLYYPLVFFLLAGFGIYDCKHKRVPNLALAFFLPVALLAPVVRAGSLSWFPLGSAALESVIGAAGCFLILLAAALVSKDGAGIGGGDIKLITLVGFIYGPAGAAGILLIASATAAAAALLVRGKKGANRLCLPFVPFLAAGSFAATIALILR